MKITVVWGPPASGKSTFVQEHRSANSLTFDFDHIMQALSGLALHHKNPALVGLVLQVRGLVLEALASDPGVEDAWIITTRLSEDLQEALAGLDVQYHLMDTDKETCLERVDADPDRADVAEETKSVIEEWFAEQQSGSHEAGGQEAGAVSPIDQLKHRLDLIKHWR